jgi:serine/threonine protein kinase
MLHFRWWQLDQDAASEPEVDWCRVRLGAKRRAMALGKQQRKPRAKLYKVCDSIRLPLLSRTEEGGDEVNGSDTLKETLMHQEAEKRGGKGEAEGKDEVNSSKALEKMLSAEVRKCGEVVKEGGKENINSLSPSNSAIACAGRDTNNGYLKALYCAGSHRKARKRKLSLSHNFVRLASGGFSDVLWSKLYPDIVVKKLKKPLCQQSCEMFDNGRKILAKLKNTSAGEYVVGLVRDVAYHNGIKHVYAMECLEGKLSSAVFYTDDKDFILRRIYYVANLLMIAVNAIHANKTSHGDISQPNVLLRVGQNERSGVLVKEELRTLDLSKAKAVLIDFDFSGCEPACGYGTFPYRFKDWFGKSFLVSVGFQGRKAADLFAVLVYITCLLYKGCFGICLADSTDRSAFRKIGCSWLDFVCSFHAMGFIDFVIHHTTKHCESVFHSKYCERLNTLPYIPDILNLDLELSTTVLGACEKTAMRF